MGKNKTAVEWLFEKLWDEPKDKFTWYALIEQAKQMEKEQIMKSFSVGNDCGYCFAKTEDSQQFNSGEQYYNETYGK